MASPAAKLSIITLSLGALLGMGGFFLLRGNGGTGEVLKGRWLVLGTAEGCRDWLPENASRPAEISELGSQELLLQAIDRAGAEGVLVARKERFDQAGRPEPAWLMRVRALDVVPGLRSERLSVRCAAYSPSRRFDALADNELSVLEEVLRGIFKGQGPPKLSSFPGVMRQKREVELVVLLRFEGELRMWRSARRSSVASAALTVAAAIRDRWRSRRAFMKQDLSAIADQVELEIWRVQDEGTVLTNSLSELDDLLPPQFGVGVERRQGWSYRLPEIVALDPVSVTRKMLEEDEIRVAELGGAAPRLYRFRLADLREP